MGTLNKNDTAKRTWEPERSGKALLSCGDFDLSVPKLRERDGSTARSLSVERVREKLRAGLMGKGLNSESKF